MPFRLGSGTIEECEAYLAAARGAAATARGRGGAVARGKAVYGAASCSGMESDRLDD
jgi:hypothetical protein